MKKLFVLLLAMISVFLFAGCNGNTIDKTKPVFDTVNISSISFREDPNVWVTVEAEELTAYVEWLGTFRIGEKTKQPLKPGSNSVTVRIEYLNGTTVEKGLSTITIDGTIYQLEYGTPPASYPSILYSNE